MKARVVLVLLAVAGLSACGYKGGLYMPDSKPKAVRPGAVITPDPAPDRPLPAESAPQPK